MESIAQHHEDAMVFINPLNVVHKDINEKVAEEEPEVEDVVEDAPTMEDVVIDEIPETPVEAEEDRTSIEDTLPNPGFESIPPVDAKVRDPLPPMPSIPPARLPTAPQEREKAFMLNRIERIRASGVTVTPLTIHDSYDDVKLECDRLVDLSKMQHFVSSYRQSIIMAGRGIELASKYAEVGRLDGWVDNGLAPIMDDLNQPLEELYEESRLQAPTPPMMQIARTVAVSALTYHLANMMTQQGGGGADGGAGAANMASMMRNMMGVGGGSPPKKEENTSARKSGRMSGPRV